MARVSRAHGVVAVARPDPQVDGERAVVPDRECRARAVRVDDGGEAVAHVGEIGAAVPVYHVVHPPPP